MVQKNYLHPWWIFLFGSTLLLTSKGYILSNGKERACPFVWCENGGTLLQESCTCVCNTQYTGLLCELALSPSKWPSGRFGLLSSMFGCPEGSGWETGAMTISILKGYLHQMIPTYLLGPFEGTRIQLNFCIKKNNQLSDKSAIKEWPAGTYCVLLHGLDCPTGFVNGTVFLKGLHVSDLTGYLPTFDTRNSSGLELHFCCRDDGNTSDPIPLPSDYPFFLMKPVSSDSCQKVGFMHEFEEKHQVAGFEGSEFFHPHPFQQSQNGHVTMNLCFYDVEFRYNCIRDRYLYSCKDNNTCGITDCAVMWSLKNPTGLQITVAASSSEKEFVKNAFDYDLKTTFETVWSDSMHWIQMNTGQILTVYRLYIQRVNNEQYENLGVHVSHHQSDFVNYGALLCDAPVKFIVTMLWSNFHCLRPLKGKFITLRTFTPGRRIWSHLSVVNIFLKIKEELCGAPLGMRSTEITNSQIILSGKTLPHTFKGERNLCVDSATGNAYIEIDLIIPTVVQAVEIKGWIKENRVHFFSSLTLEYAVHYDQFHVYADPPGVPKEFFVGRYTDVTKIQNLVLRFEFVARYVRLRLKGPTDKLCVNFELFGCPKRVIRDLSCGSQSKDIGWEVLPKLKLNDTYQAHMPNVSSGNLSQCLQVCLQSASCLSVNYQLQSNICWLNKVQRYDHRFLYAWLANPSADMMYSQRICIKDVYSPLKATSVTIAKPCILYSPGYPFYYGQNMKSTWIVKFLSGEIPVLDVIDVWLPVTKTFHNGNQKLKWHIECVDKLTFSSSRNSERLQFIKNRKITAKEAVKYVGSKYIGVHEVVKVEIESCVLSSAVSSAGFVINITKTDCTGCSGDNSEKIKCFHSCGYIMSPNYPSDYEINLQKTWEISVEKLQYIALEFLDMDIPSESICKSNYLEVIDRSASLMHIIVIGRFCNAYLPPAKLVSKYSKMIINFRTRIIEEYRELYGRGFLLKYHEHSYDINQVNVTKYESCLGAAIYFNGKCHSLVVLEKQKISWDEANQHCQQLGGNLSSVDTIEEMKFLHQKLVIILEGDAWTTDGIYIGLKKNDDNGRFSSFKWLDEMPLTYTRWNSSGQYPSPNGGRSEECTIMEMNGFFDLPLWDDVPCRSPSTRKFLCEVIVESGYHVNQMLPLMEPKHSSRLLKNNNIFMCGSFEFMSALYVCDGVEDCLDGSDEMTCEPHCSSTQFHCGNGQCVSLAFYCDHKSDCSDGSDESHCVYPTCSSDEWRCDNYQCIRSHQRCDLVFDCLDHSDEELCGVCSQPLATQCYDRSCIPSSRNCDGFTDCSNQEREDEVLNCSRLHPSSCGDWYALGFTENRIYKLFNLNEEKNAFCDFSSFEASVVTIITPDQTKNVNDFYPIYKKFETIFKYAGWTMASLASLIDRTICRQYAEYQCQAVTLLHEIIFNRSHSYLNFSREEHNCQCLLQDSCQNQSKRCECDRTVLEWMDRDEKQQFSNAVYFVEDIQIPITKIVVFLTKSNGKYLGEARVGPLECFEEKVTAPMYRCKQGKSIDSQQRCRLEFDEQREVRGCRDLSHLQDCKNFSCPNTFVKCPDSFCIPISLVCDGQKHCSHGEDEVECKSRSCPGYYRCRNSSICILPVQVCNEIRDCPAGDDEYLCHVTCPQNCTCAGGVFECSKALSLFHLPPEIRKINLSFNPIVAQRLSLKTFLHLGILDLSFCNLHHIPLDHFSNLQNLYYLDLSHNLIKSLAPGIFRGLHRLKTLLLAGNLKIQKLEPSSFLGLSRLPKLDLSELSLVEIADGAFSNLESLQVLNLSHNQLYSVSRSPFLNLTKLKVIDLRYNRIRKFSENTFTSVSSLQTIFSDLYGLCCVRPASVHKKNCFPQVGEFSSCKDLMKNETFRVFLLLFGFVSLLGNIFVMMYWITSDRGAKTSYSIIVVNLSVSDFLMGVYLLIIAAADIMYRGRYAWKEIEWKESHWCRLAGVLSTLSSEASVIFLCLITVDRFLIIKFPFGQRQMTRKHALVSCLCTWLVTILISVFPLFPMEYFSNLFYTRSGVCLALPLSTDHQPGSEYAIAIFIVGNFFAFLMIAVGQLLIYRQITQTSIRNQYQQRGRDLSVAKRLLLVVLTDFICWFPICVMGLFTLTGYPITGEVYVWTVVFILPINSALNPILYTLSTPLTQKDIGKVKQPLKIARFFNWSNQDDGKSKHNDVSHSIVSILKNDSLVRRWSFADSTAAVPLKLCRQQLSLREQLRFLQKILSTLSPLHKAGLCCTHLDDDHIHLELSDNPSHKVIKKVYFDFNPKMAEREDDILEDMGRLGNLVKRMLLARTLPATKASC